MSNTCGCTRPVRNGYTICDTCRADLEQHLAEMHWLEDELTTSLIGSKGIDYRTLGGAKSDTVPLPWNERASRAKAALKAELVRWVRDIVPRPDWPSDRLTALAACLMVRLNDIAKRDDAQTIFDTITDASQKARAIVFAKPEEKRLIGNCDGRIVDNGDDDITEHPCDGLVYAPTAAPTGECDQCHRLHDADEKRAELLAKMEDRLVGLREATKLIGYLALDVKPETMRSQLHRWIDKGIIAPRTHDGEGRAMYRFGEVRDTLTSHYVDKRA